MKMQADERPVVSVIIVTYNCAVELDACLQSLSRSSLPIEVFVVDNDSQDDVKTVVDAMQDNMNLVMVPLARNVGLAAANNIPIQTLSGRYTLILNPDVCLNQDALLRLVEYMEERPDVVAVGPLQVYVSGMPHSSFHRRWTFIHKITWHCLPRAILARLYADRPDRFREQDVYFVSGSCLLTKTSAYKQIAGYDPAFFLAVEDAADLCRRLRSAGGRVRFVPKVAIMHAGARSSVKVRPMSFLKGCQGQIHYARKWYGSTAAGLMIAIVIANSAIKWLVFRTLGLCARRYVESAHVHAFALRNLFQPSAWLP